jgi:hypothetical protein
MFTPYNPTPEERLAHAAEAFQVPKIRFVSKIHPDVWSLLFDGPPDTIEPEDHEEQILDPETEDRKLLELVRCTLARQIEDERTPAETIEALTKLHAHLSTLLY